MPICERIAQKIKRFLKKFDLKIEILFVRQPNKFPICAITIPAKVIVVPLIYIGSVCVNSIQLEPDVIQVLIHPNSAPNKIIIPI
jgi:hypothetical protein